MADDTAVENDAQLIARIRNGEEDALRDLLSTYGGRIRLWLRKTYRSILQEEEVDEALSAAVTKVWQNADKFDSSRGRLGGWFLRIAQREAINILRQQKTFRLSHRQLTFDVEDETEQFDSDDSAAPKPESQGRIDALHRIIEGLPPKQKAITLADLAAGGPADAERLALQLGTSTNSIYVLRNRAREHIRKAMRELGYYQETSRNEP